MQNMKKWLTMYVQNTSLKVHNKYQSPYFNGMACLGTESLKKSSELWNFKGPDPYLISTEPLFSYIKISKSKAYFYKRFFASSSPPGVL